MSGPIRPVDVLALKSRQIPNAVYEAFNELIAENWRHGRSTVAQDKVVTRILAKMLDTTRTQLFDSGWLDVEDSYRQQGWKVTYDKSAYNETYEATFVFESSEKRSDGHG